MKVEKVEKYVVGNESFDTQKEAEEYLENIEKTSLNRDYYILSMSPVSIYSKSIFGDVSIISVPKYNVDLLKNFIANVNYHIEGPYRFDTLEETFEFLRQDFSPKGNMLKFSNVRHLKINEEGEVIN